MKTLIFTILISFIVIPLANENKSKDEKTVSLTQVSPLLSPYQGNDTYDFIQDKVNYKYIEEQKYDDVFEESAVIYATIKQLRETVNGINNGSIAEDNEFAVLSIGFAVNDLPKMDDRIKELTAETKTMKPTEDFTGKKALKAGKALDGLNMSKNYLQQSAELLPVLMTDVTEVSQRVLKD